MCTSHLQYLAPCESVRAEQLSHISVVGWVIGAWMDCSPPAVPVITLPVIIGVVVVCVCLVVVLVVAVILVICLCYCCWRRRRNKFSLWEEDESRRNGNHYSSDVEMEHIRFSPSSSQKCEGSAHAHTNMHIRTVYSTYRHNTYSIYTCM